MCAILGVYKKTGAITEQDLENLNELIRKNLSRGTMAWGLISPTAHIRRIVDPATEDFSFLKKFIGEKYLLLHFRAPTGESKNNIDSTQPVIFKGYCVLHNGLLHGWQEHYMTRHGNLPTDTWFIASLLHRGGPGCLKKINGSAALAVIEYNDDGDKFYLFRSINPLYYSEEFISSVPFEGAKELEHGTLRDFNSGQEWKFELRNPYATPPKTENIEPSEGAHEEQ